MMTQKNIYWITAMLLVDLIGAPYLISAQPLPKLEIKRPKTEVKTPASEFELREPEEIYKRVFKTSPTCCPPNEKEKRTGRTPQQILEQAGIDFPKGTSAEYDWDTGRLTVQHKPDGMLLVEAYIDRVSSRAERHLIFQLEIYRLPALLVLELQQSASEQADHTPERNAVYDLIKTEHAKLIGSLSLESRSGQRATMIDGLQYRYLDRYEWDEKSQKILPVFMTQDVGTVLEIDPVLGADDSTMDVSFSFEHHTAPPDQKMTQIRLPDSESNIEFPVPVFHSKKVITQITMQSGTTRMICVYRPTGDEEYQKKDLMEVVFLKASVASSNSPLFTKKEVTDH
ncbi:MAG: hypothetical protein L3J39_06255 [Verrucomicrobiales bacterium]|nr:hypothetical protein [Verrucomicrobiales bacterium]